MPSPTPGDLPNTGVEPASLASPVLAGGFHTTSATWTTFIFSVTICSSFSQQSVCGALVLSLVLRVSLDVSKPEILN